MADGCSSPRPTPPLQLRRSVGRMNKRLGQSAAVVATVVFAALFLRGVSWSDTRSHLGAIPILTALAAVAAVLVSMLFTAPPWRSLLRAAGVEGRVPRLFAGLAAGAAVNNVVPARGGDVVGVRSVPGRSTAVVGTLAAERLLDGFVLALFIVLGAAVTGGRAVVLLYV